MSLPSKPSRHHPVAAAITQSEVELTEQELTCVCGGQNSGLGLYCIELASVVSKYIGDTEKNLKRL